MNERPEVEFVLRAWFEDGPATMPDHVIDEVADRIGHQPQLPAWRVSWRDTPVNAYIKPLVAVAAVVLIAVMGIAVIGRPSGRSVGGDASPSPSPPPSATPVAAATLPWDDRDPNSCGQFGCGGPQTAGTYTSKALKPAVTYTLTTNWVNVRDWPEYFQLYPDTPANRALAAAGTYPPYILILPGPTMVSPSAACQEEGASDEVEVNATQFVEYLTARAGLSTTEPAQVMIGGLSGQRIDVGFETGWAGCLPGTSLGETLAQSERVRFIVLDQPDGKSLMIRLRPITDFNAYVQDAMPIVESFEFDLGQ